MTEVLDVLIDAATGPLAWPALVAAAVGLVLVRTSGRGSAGQAVAVAVAAIAVLVAGFDAWLVVGAGLVVAGEEVGGLGTRADDGGGARRVVGVLLVTVGIGVAILLTPLIAGRQQLIAALLAVAVVPILLDTEGSSDWVAGLLLPISLAGIYVTVPDVKLAIIALAASLPSIVLGSAGRLGVQSWSLVLLIAASGGVSRTASLVGAIGCLGIFLIPTAHRIPRWAVLAVHIGIVAVASRIAGLRSDVVVATLIVLAAVVVGSLLLTRGRLGRG